MSEIQQGRENERFIKGVAFIKAWGYAEEKKRLKKIGVVS